MALNQVFLQEMSLNRCLFVSFVKLFVTRLNVATKPTAVHKCINVYYKPQYSYSHVSATPWGAFFREEHYNGYMYIEILQEFVNQCTYVEYWIFF